MIVGQSICQVITTLIFHFFGYTILGIDRTDKGDKIATTLVFSTFAFARIFNSADCRRLDDRLNIF